MRISLVGLVAFAVTSAVGAAAVTVWLTGGSAYVVPARKHIHVDIPPRPPYPKGTLETFDVKPADLRGAWPGFRGPNRDNIAADMVELARTWPGGRPSTLWAIDVGQGHASAAILDGRVYVHDYNETDRRDVIRCLSLADGRDIWNYAYRVRLKPNHGMSRTVPAVTDKHLLALSPVCHVTCLNSQTGELIWEINLPEEYGAKIPDWYAGQCPLIDDGKAILGVGGKVTTQNGVTKGKDVLMMAVDCATGKVLWQTPNPKQWAMTHSSVAVWYMEDGTRSYVYAASDGVVGVSAEDGRVLWSTGDWKTRIAAVASPLPIDGERLLLSSGYGAGAIMLRVAKEGDRYAAKVLFKLEANVFGSEQQTPIFYKGHVFGSRPDGQFVCMDLRGEIVWSSGPDNKFGKHGPYLIADDMILLMNDDGVLTLLEATPAGYKRLAQAEVLAGHHSWGPMALANGRLIVRNLTRMACLDLNKQTGGDAPR